jgi:hypothetical protein
MRVLPKSRNAAVVATAAAAFALGAAGPAAAGQGDPGPGGPLRYVFNLTESCDYLTGQLVVTVTLTQGPDYTGWQHAGVYYAVRPVTSSPNYGDVSNDTYAGSGILGPGASPLSYTFRLYPPAAGTYLEVDTIDISPADGYWTDANVRTPASCFLHIVPLSVVSGAMKL